jgi:hypothetical protein
MRYHRNPRPKVPKQPPADNFEPVRLTVRGEPPPRRLTKEALLTVEDALDELRHLIARTAASVYATDDLFEKLIWDDRSDGRDEERRIEHLLHLIDATKEAVASAVDMGEEISSALFRLRVGGRGAKP